MVSLETFFHAQSIAVIGASRNPSKIGHVILDSLKHKYRGKLFPINPNTESILGIECYPSVHDVNEPIDLAVISVPVDLALRVINDCAKKGIKHLIMVTAGFAEIGNTKAEHDILNVLRKNNMRLIGGNCLGVLDTTSNIDTLFLPISRLKRPKAGGISFICQSGAVGSTVLDLMADQSIGFAKFISYGNALDINETDLLEYLGEDKETKVICMYVEGIKDGRRFMDVAKKVTTKKPVIFIKGGITEKGAKAALSHTASLAGAPEVYKGALKQCNVIQTESLEDMFNFANLLDFAPKPKGRRVQVITNGGGFGILCVDQLNKHALEVEDLPNEIKKKFVNVFPKDYIVSNPLDLTGAATTEQYKISIDACLRNPKIDIVLVVLLLHTPLITPDIVPYMIKTKKASKKPLAIISTGGNFIEIHKRHLEEGGVPCFTFPLSAVTAIKALCDYYHV